MRKVTIKIELERINTQEEVIVETLLNSRTTELVISLEFTKKQRFKLKRIEELIYIRNVNRSFNKEESIEHIVEVNIYYQEHRKRIEINVIRGQKWSVILWMPWLACHNLGLTREQKR